jgi:hypothetical protein
MTKEIETLSAEQAPKGIYYPISYTKSAIIYCLTAF